METFLKAFSMVVSVLFLFGVVGCLIVIPKTAWALIMSAFETPDRDENQPTQA